MRAYQVGFGDCFLLTFQYQVEADQIEERHVLIDFGSTARPKVAPKDLMMRVANNIKERCNGKLHAVVATHRHKDHISGFATNQKDGGTGKIIADCEPEIVIQSWTEHPDTQRAALQAPFHSTDTQHAFLAALDRMHSVSRAILTEAKHLNSGISQSLIGELRFLATDNQGDKELSNQSAITNLRQMAKARRGNVYVSCGSDLELGDILPGVTTHVLGPPTLKQTKAILRETDADPEFWMLQANAGSPGNGEARSLFDGFQSSSSAQKPPPHTRWFIRHLHIIRANQLLEIVRILDHAMNNTSIILLFEAGGKKLLFPGDAQLENWHYALYEADKRDEFRKLLADVHLYKVGHHGSRNATPHTLWEMFARRRDKQSDGDLKTVVSTREGKHGGKKPESHSEVPRESLVTALKKGSEYFSTQTLIGDDKYYQDIEIDLSSEEAESLASSSEAG